jgi:hypothetical protein
MAFNKQNTQQTITENNNLEKGITATIANYIPMATLLFEQVTGQSIPLAKGTLADILTHLQKIEAKIDDLERSCSEQFQLQEAQLSSLQKVSKLVQETKSIHFGNTKPSQIED